MFITLKPTITLSARETLHIIDMCFYGSCALVRQNAIEFVNQYLSDIDIELALSMESHDSLLKIEWI